MRNGEEWTGNVICQICRKDPVHDGKKLRLYSEVVRSQSRITCRAVTQPDFTL